VAIGLIADTHGLIRPEALRALSGVQLILHAGDVGGRSVLAALRAVAPVRAVPGNVDDESDPELESTITLEAGGLTVHVSHGHELGSPTPAKLLARYSADVIVFGHTHRAVVHRAGRRLVVNPGAAGPRRFNLVPSVALLHIEGRHAEVEIVPL
jgi:putative phosphoesterase